MGGLSGTTRYVSLATAAFVGIGTYTVALLSDHLSLAMVLAIARRLVPWWHSASACRRCG